MIRYALPLFAASALAAPAAAANIEIAATGPVVELSVTETVKSEPDLATVSAGVTTQARTAVEAMRLNASQMDAVIRRIKSLGVDEEDIQTTGINLNAQYDYDRTQQRQIFRGYQVSNRVSVTLRDIDATGEVLDALVAAGATDLGGPGFSRENDDEAKAQARRAALESARAQAMEYASWAGYSGLRLLEVNETISSGRPMPMLRTMAVEEAADASTPVQPGLVSSNVTLTVKFEMTQ